MAGKTVILSEWSSAETVQYIRRQAATVEGIIRTQKLDILL